MIRAFGLEALIFLRFIALTKIKEYNSIEDLKYFGTFLLYAFAVEQLS